MLRGLTIGLSELRSLQKRGAYRIIPPLSSDEASLLIATVGSACENPRCRSQLNLEVRHIKPRAEGRTHSVWNLIVLCHGCHGHEGRGAWSRALLKQWVKKHSLERSRLLRSGEWKIVKHGPKTSSQRAAQKLLISALSASMFRT